jgi:hypothetical protein
MASNRISLYKTVHGTHALTYTEDFLEKASNKVCTVAGGAALGGSGHNGLHKLVDKRFTKRNGKPGAHVGKVEREKSSSRRSIAVELLDIYSDCGRLKMPQVPCVCECGRYTYIWQENSLSPIERNEIFY